MSTRLATGGRLLNKNRAMTFSFNGQSMRGFEGDTLASALLANDQMLVGARSNTTARAGSWPPGGRAQRLVNWARQCFEPNQRVTTTELFDGLRPKPKPLAQPRIRRGRCECQAERGLCPRVSITRCSSIRVRCGNMCMSRSSARRPVGRAPRNADGDTYEHFYAFCDVLVIGAGVAGLAGRAQRRRGGRAGAVLEQTAPLGRTCASGWWRLRRRTAEQVR